MQKILFTISNHQVSSYSFFAVLALFIVFIGTYFFALARGFEKKSIIISLFVMSVSAIIGARLFHIATNFSLYVHQPWRIYSFDFIGFAIFGGIIGGMLMAIVCAKYFKFSIWKFGDTIAPFLGLGIVSMRIGCFLNGCCFGKETDLPWGVIFPFMSYAHKYQLSQNIEHMFFVSPVHPTQIYELFYALLASLLAVLILRKKVNDGLAILVAGLVYTIGRLVNFYLRVPPSTFEAPVYFYPLIYGGMILLILFLIRKSLV